jgi:hypothetical protein
LAQTTEPGKELLFMPMATVAYARRAYKSFSRSARHISQLIASHQTLETGWAYIGYDCLADESSLTPRRVMQLVACLEDSHVLEVRRGHGRGHVNFYRLLDEHTGAPVPVRTAKKVKIPTASPAEKVKFPTPPAAEKVKSESGNLPKALGNIARKVVQDKEKKDKDAPTAPRELTWDKPEQQHCFWCDPCGVIIQACLHRVVEVTVHGPTPNPDSLSRQRAWRATSG